MNPTPQLAPPAETLGWRPLLTGPLATQARDAVDAIVADLATSMPKPIAATLADGDAGVALLYAYLARHGVTGAEERVCELLDSAAAAVAARPLGPSLYSGYTGVAWAIAHARPASWELWANDDALAEIDGALLALVGRGAWRSDYDLISGLVGFGVYALERLPRPEAAACLTQIVARLAETAEHQADGVTWWTGPQLLIEPTRSEHPGGYYNLGLAHGVPGVIALLGAICATGVAHELARPLLDGAVSWLLAQQLPVGERSCFGYWVGPAIAPAPSRLAWCYGDLGVAAALLAAARCVAEPAWEEAALRIARAAAARAERHTGVIDAGICHGSAGVAHLFNRIYQASGEALFADAACRWLAHTLALRQPGRGIGGFLAYEPGPDRAMAWTASPGFLSGAAGVGLALLAATTVIASAWDKVLLAWIPCRGGPSEQVPALPHRPVVSLELA